MPSASPNLDGFGNLRGGDVRVLGFEMPLGAKPTGKGISQFVSASEERFVRFFRSRGYHVETLMQGAHKITHSERTLSLLDADAAKNVATAQLFVNLGPGPGYTMLFNPGRSQAQRPVLDELREAERQNDPKFKAAAKAEAALAAKRARDAAEKAAEKAAKAPTTAKSPHAKTAKAPIRRVKSTSRRVYTPADVERLRSKARAKLANPRIRAMADKIRAWEQKTGRVFYD